MKIWLGLITSDKETQNIDGLTQDIYTHFDGICAVVHKQGGDNRVREILESRKGGGIVVEREFLPSHSHSMNEFLFQPRIKLGDVLAIRDSSERFNPNFTKDLKPYCQHLQNQGINSVYQRSKMLFFTRWFNQQFINGLHWGLVGAVGRYMSIDVQPGFEDDKTYAYSLRNELRKPTHRYEHECRYLIDYGANGNHLQLFYPNNAEELQYHQLELYRFLNYLSQHSVETAAQFKDFLLKTPMNDTLKHHINLERPFRNFYRHYVLGENDDTIVKDEDLWRIS